MLIPIADVPRWYAERKPKDAVAISHGADVLTWEQFERNANRRARAFAAKGVKPAISLRSGCPTAMCFSKPLLRCGNAARRRRR
jgi:bile acid-coenzyme A ligase